MNNSQDKETASTDQQASLKRGLEGELDVCPPSSRAKYSSQGGDEPNPIIRLNVGGTRYEVSRDTLMRYEGSMLARLVSGKWKEGEGDKEIFIDRDGARFKYILDYLRSDCLRVPHLSDRSTLKDEFDFFGIDADMSKVSVVDDFTAIDQLSKEIKEHERIIEQKKKKIAAMKHSYHIANEFSSRAEENGLSMKIKVAWDIDKELLRGCLLARGLQVVAYHTDEYKYETIEVSVSGGKHIEHADG